MIWKVVLPYARGFCTSFYLHFRPCPITCTCSGLLVLTGTLASTYLPPFVLGLDSILRIYLNMRSTFRCFQSANRGLLRSHTTSFIGLGRMGYQMAYNLFSKQHVKENDSRFIVCDVVPDASRAFCTEFIKQYPNAQLSIVDTPEEWVHPSRPMTS